jgi:hypothetical protein
MHPPLASVTSTYNTPLPSRSVDLITPVRCDERSIHVAVHCTHCSALIVGSLLSISGMRACVCECVFLCVCVCFLNSKDLFFRLRVGPEHPHSPSSVATSPASSAVHGQLGPFISTRVRSPHSTNVGQDSKRAGRCHSLAVHGLINTQRARSPPRRGSHTLSCSPTLPPSAGLRASLLAVCNSTRCVVCGGSVRQPACTCCGVPLLRR